MPPPITCHCGACKKCQHRINTRLHRDGIKRKKKRLVVSKQSAFAQPPREAQQTEYDRLMRQLGPWVQRGSAY